MTVQEFVNIDKDLQTVLDISDVNIIILIYLFIKHVLFILMYLHKCKMHVTMSAKLKVHLFIWLHNFRFSMSLSLSPNYRLHRRWRFNEGALYISYLPNTFRDRRGHDCMVVGFTTTYTISAYHHWSCEFESGSWRGILDVIKFVIDLQQVGGFLQVLQFPWPIKLTTTI